MALNPKTIAHARVQAMISRAQKAGNKGKVQDLVKRLPQLVKIEELSLRKDAAIAILERRV